MKKALMYASVASMIDMFNMNNIEILKDLGYQVDVACNFEDRSTTTDAKIEAFKKKTPRFRCFLLSPTNPKTN